MDPLSHILSTFDVNGILSARLELAGDWSFQFGIAGAIKIGAVVQGQCWLRAHADRPAFYLEAGDCYLLSGISSYQIASDASLEATDDLAQLREGKNSNGVLYFRSGGTKTILIGALFELTAGGSVLLSRLLPSVVCLPLREGQPDALRSILDLIISETLGNQPGRAMASSSLAKFTLVSVLRATMDLPSLNGWLRALASSHYRA